MIITTPSLKEVCCLTSNISKTYSQHFAPLLARILLHTLRSGNVTWPTVPARAQNTAYNSTTSWAIFISTLFSFQVWQGDFLLNKFHTTLHYWIANLMIFGMNELT